MSETQDNKLVTVSYLKKVLTPVVTVVKDVEQQAANALTLPAGGIPGQVIVKLSETDGDVAWIDLPVSGGGIACYETRNDFPVTGVEDTLYVAEDERVLYQWDSDAQEYEQIGLTSSGTSTHYTVIHGGNAAGE